MLKAIIALLALAATAGAVNAETQQNEQNTGAAKPAGSQNTNKGTVLEIFESPMYTYLQVSCDTGAVWLAVNRNTAQIAKGDTVSYPNGVVMRNFYSKSLNRTVAKIIFVNNVVQEK